MRCTVQKWKKHKHYLTKKLTNKFIKIRQWSNLLLTFRHPLLPGIPSGPSVFKFIKIKPVERGGNRKKFFPRPRDVWGPADAQKYKVHHNMPF